MNTSLTSFDGYPRADIDVAQIRTTRAQIIRLKNDHKELMKELEAAIHEQFAAAKTNGQDATSTGAAAPLVNVTGASIVRSSDQSTRAMPAVEPPFARVNTVVPSSPAAAAGLAVGDQVTRFGAINWTNHERLSRVAQVVQQNENQPVVVKVLRESSTIQLTLTPRRDWGGRGLLGCHLLPV